MELNDLTAVVQVYRLQSFSEAAFQMDYSASAISKQIKRVEKELGFTIFTRGSKKKRVALTESGAAVLPLLQKMAEEYTALTILADSLRDNTGKMLLRVGYPPLIGTFGETEILNSFSIAHTNVDILHTHTGSSALLRQVVEGKLDCAFLFVIGSLPLEKLFSQFDLDALEMIHCNTFHGMYVGLPADDPVAQRGTVMLEELADRTFAFLKTPDDLKKGRGKFGTSSMTINSFLECCGAKEIAPQVRYFDTMSHNVFSLAAAGEIVLPVMQVGYTYEGVRFVKVSDWENTGRLFFALKKNHSSKILQELKQTVLDFADNHVPKPMRTKKLLAAGENPLQTE